MPSKQTSIGHLAFDIFFVQVTSSYPIHLKLALGWQLYFQYCTAYPHTPS